MSSDKGLYRCLETLSQHGSTSRLLNLCAIAERHADNPDHARLPMFHDVRLNKSLIVKHTLRAHERRELKTSRASVTKVILPFSYTDLKMGGSSVFVEEQGFERALAVGLGMRHDTQEFIDDMEMLRLLASLPSLDPFLVRERIAGHGRHVARCYFELSDSDAAQMRQHVANEIERLVSLAFFKGSGAASGMAKKMAEKMLRDDTAEALEPLRQTLRMSVSEYAEAMFAWKGFLYYKWCFGDITPSLRPTTQEVMTVKIGRTTRDDLVMVENLRRKVVDGIVAFAKDSAASLEKYDYAFTRLVDHGDAPAFRLFLMTAPSTFLHIGDTMGVLAHIISFWQFRFRQSAVRKLEADEALELFAEFAMSLTPRATVEL